MSTAKDHIYTRRTFLRTTAMATVALAAVDVLDISPALARPIRPKAPLAPGLDTSPTAPATATWMADLRAQIGHLPLRMLPIPGTHDSGAYSLGLGPHPNFRYYNNARTQSLTITRQLEAGYRYFDLRAAKLTRNGNDRALRIYHGAYGPGACKAGICVRAGDGGARITDLIDEVNTWLKAHPKEIVILDFGAFNTTGPDKITYVTATDHEQLAHDLVSAFDTMLASTPTYEADFELMTVKTLQDKGQQVVILYRDDASYHLPQDFFTSPAMGAGKLWPRSVWRWDDYEETTNLDTLRNKLQLPKYDSLGRSKVGFGVWQGIRTPPAPAGLFGGSAESSVEDYALDANPTIAGWVNTWDPRRFNIIIMDWVASSPLVDLIVRRLRGGSLAVVAVSTPHASEVEIDSSIQNHQLTTIGQTSAVACGASAIDQIQIYTVDTSGAVWHSTNDLTQKPDPVYPHILNAAYLGKTGAEVACAVSPTSGERFLLVVTRNPRKPGGWSMSYLQQSKTNTWTVAPTQVSGTAEPRAVRPACALWRRHEEEWLFFAMVDEQDALWYYAPAGPASTVVFDGHDLSWQRAPNASSIGRVIAVACAGHQRDRTGGGSVQILALSEVGRLYYASYDGSWSSFEEIKVSGDGVHIGAAATIACTCDSTTLFVFVTDQSGQVWHLQRDLTQGRWGAFLSMGFLNPTLRLACVSDIPGHVVVCASVAGQLTAPRWKRIGNTVDVLVGGGKRLYALTTKGGQTSVASYERSRWSSPATTNATFAQVVADNRALYGLAADRQSVQEFDGANWLTIGQKPSVQQKGKFWGDRLVAGNGQLYSFDATKAYRYEQNRDWLDAPDWSDVSVGGESRAIAASGLYSASKDKGELWLYLSDDHEKKSVATFPAGSQVVLVAGGDHLYTIVTSADHTITRLARYEAQDLRTKVNQVATAIPFPPLQPAASAPKLYVAAATDLMFYLSTGPTTLWQFDGTTWLSVWDAQAVAGLLQQMAATSQALYVGTTGGDGGGVYEFAP